MTPQIVYTELSNLLKTNPVQMASLGMVILILKETDRREEIKLQSELERVKGLVA